jgi:intracellular septation protein A
MKIWTYRYRFAVATQRVEIRIVCLTTVVETTVSVDGQVAATHSSSTGNIEGLRNHQLTIPMSDGRPLTVVTGYATWYAMGARAHLDGAPVFESHPGRTLAWPQWMLEAVANNDVNDPAVQLRHTKEQEQWQRNKPSLLVDIGLGLLFFVVAKFTDLTTAALVGAAVGLSLVIVQRYVKVDLLGGLAMFGVVMLLFSAGFSILFQDDWAVKMKSTVLGVLVAGFMLTDGFTNSGRYFGARMARYIAMPIDVRRLALGLGSMALTMALINWLVASTFSTNVWLYYSTFGDMALAMAGFFAVLRFAKQ